MFTMDALLQSPIDSGKLLEAFDADSVTPSSDGITKLVLSAFWIAAKVSFPLTAVPKSGKLISKDYWLFP